MRRLCARCHYLGTIYLEPVCLPSHLNSLKLSGKVFEDDANNFLEPLVELGWLPHSLKELSMGRYSCGLQRLYKHSVSGADEADICMRAKQQLSDSRAAALPSLPQGTNILLHAALLLPSCSPSSSMRCSDIRVNTVILPAPNDKPTDCCFQKLRSDS